MTPMLKTKASLTCLVLFAFTQAVYAAGTSGEYNEDGGVASRATTVLDLLGTQSFRYNDSSDNTARIKSAEVRNNRPSGVSGALSIQLWAFFTPFKGAGGQTGYKLAEAPLGTLPAGSSIRNIDQTVPGLVIPPDGTYFGSFILIENNGTQDFFFDYINFTGTVVYTNGEANVNAPAKLSVSSSSVSAKQNAPFSFSFTSSGSLPVTYSATGLPSGLELKNTTVDIDTSGVIFPLISGIPKKAGTFPVTLQASNADGSNTFALSLTVEPSSDNVAPTISTLQASPNPASTGKRVSFTSAATDPENVSLTYTWDFKDGTILSGPVVFHTFSTAGTYNVSLSVSDGVNSTQQTLSLEVNGAPTLDPFVDLITASINPAPINTVVTLTATASSPVGEALTYTWNFGDGTPTATGNPVTHAYITKGEYSVSVTVQDISLRLGSFSEFTMFVTDSSDPKNLINGQTTVSPDGVQILVVPSPPGLLALDLSLVAAPGAVARANVDFDTSFLIPGRQATAVSGARPVNRINRVGVVVATATGTPVGAPADKKLGRKTIPIGAKDLGEIPVAPDTLTDAEKIVSTGKISGSFNFTSDKVDKISASFSIPLPEGYDLLRSQELSIGVSNVADRIVLDAKGKATGLADRGILQKVSIKYPKRSGGTSLLGDTAQISVTFTAPNLDQAGFESDGITASSSGSQTLQVAIVLAGIPYSGTIPIELKVSTKGDKGTVKLAK